MNETKQPAVGPRLDAPVRPLMERLEAAAHAWENSLTVCGDHMPSPAMLREAKAEIERLRAAADAVLQVVKFYGGCYGCTPKDRAAIIALSRLLRPNVRAKPALPAQEQR